MSIDLIDMLSTLNCYDEKSFDNSYASDSDASDCEYNDIQENNYTIYQAGIGEYDAFDESKPYSQLLSILNVFNDMLIKLQKKMTEDKVLYNKIFSKREIYYSLPKLCDYLIENHMSFNKRDFAKVVGRVFSIIDNIYGILYEDNLDECIRSIEIDISILRCHNLPMLCLTL